MNKNILVAGGAGFIGSHLVDELLSNNYNVKVLDNLSNGSITNLKDALKSNNFTFIEGDILDKTFQNHKSIKLLEQLRDTLLPKLMNGEFKVGLD